MLLAFFYAGKGFAQCAPDITFPTITCPADIIQANDPGTCAAVVTYVAPVGADNCVGPVTTMTAGLASGATFPLGLTVVTYQVVDGAGNTTSCSFNVTINDTESPTIACPIDVVVNSDAGLCTASGVALGVPVTNDNCSVASVTNNAPAIFPLGATVVTWTVTDGAGLTATCNQTVTVNDTEAPTISCPGLVSVSADAGLCTASGVALGVPVTGDNCSVASVTNNAPAIFPLGNTTVTWTVTDGAGLTATCNQTVTVTDNEVPTIACPAGFSVNVDAGLCTASGVALGVPVSGDNCSVASVTNNAPSPFPLGATVVTWTVTDGSTNTATCNQTITVIDNIVPSITCPADVIVNAGAGTCTASGVALGSPATSDNCSVASVTNNAPATFPLGNTTVTWTVTDGAGLTATCNQTVTVNDTESPTITCPGAVSVSADAGLCTASVVALGAPTTSDNCSVASVTNNAPALFPLGNTTVTWTVTDGAGLTATCNQTVTVTDGEDPTIACPANVNANVDAGLCTASGVALGVPVTGDNCSVASVTNNAPASYPLGNTTVTWTVTDGSGNTATCDQTVTVTDNIPPTITCPVDVVVNSGAGTCTASGVALGAPTTNDNCSVASVTNNAPATFPLGNTTVTWTVTDGAGLTATCNQTVTVNDTESPTITCPGAVSVSADAGLCTASGVALGAPTTSDNCSVASVTNNAPALFPLGNTTVTWTVTDGAGLTATCNQTVTVTDGENPTIACPANVNANVDAGLCTASGVALGVPVTGDNCSVASVTNNAPSPFPLGATTVTWTVTDGSGNTTTCNQIVTVTDNIPPTITCPVDVVVVAGAGTCTASGVALGAPTTNDNCSVASVTNNAPATFPLGNTTVTWTVTDGAGLTATCNQTVTVNDTQLPTISCPSAVTVSADAGLCTASGVALGAPTTSDNCSVASVTNNAPAIFPLGNTTVTWTVTDGSGNIATCMQTVIVNDTENPTIACPADVSVNADAGLCTAAGVALGVPVTGDNCSVASVTNNAPATFPLGNTTVTWTVTDGSGNFTTCNQIVTVTDNQAPSIVCPANVSVFAGAGTCTASGVALGVPATSDNCSVASVTNNAPVTFPLGNTTVIWTVTDGSGLTATCNQTVTVNDNELPTINCPANITVSADAGLCTASGVALGAPTTADNCSVASVTNNAPAIFPLGATTVTWTVTDGSGNIATCSQTVTVNDTENPTIACPADVSVNSDAGICTASGVSLGVPITGDNCSVASVSNNAPAVFPLGNTTVTWTVVDGTGNFTTCNQIVTVTDNELPTITCPIDVTVNAGAGSCTASGVALGAPVTGDNCLVASVTNNAPATFPLGNTTVIWTVTDGSGNTATCNQIVTVVDNQPPTISCPSGVTVSADAGLCTASGVALGVPITGDNCSVASVTNNAPAIFPLGITTVTWTVTDGAGLTATCTQNITVNDTEVPTITCPADVVVSSDAGICTASGVALGVPTTADNCSVASVTNNAPAIFPLGNTTVTWTVTDGSGLTATCNQIVTVNDTENPTITCPADVSVNSDAGICTASGVALGVPTTADNCSVASVTNNAPATFPLGNTTVTWTVTDGSGLTATCDQIVTVTDIELPTIACPIDVSVNADAGICTASGVALGAPVTGDNCSVASVTNNAPVNFPLGNTTVVWTVTDGSGNTANCNQIVTVIDNQVPTITCPVNVTVSADVGLCTASLVVLGVPVTGDNCSVASVTNDAPAIFPLGNTTVTWTVTDGAGLTATCNQTVTVNDTESPTITCPADVVVNSDAGICTASAVALGVPLTSDNCSVASVTNNAPAIFPLGNTTVTWIVTDGAGLVAVCTQTVTVTDAELPTIACPADVVVNSDAGLCTASGVALGAPVTGDNCSVASVTNNAPGTFPLGNTAVTWTVTDGAGLIATCDQLVTVIDNELPTITCPGTVTVSADAGVCTASGVVLGVPGTSDNCSIASVTNDAPAVFPLGNTTVTWTVTDGAGLTATCTQTVTVNDTESPTITCPADVAVNSDAGLCTASGVALGVPTTNDNCSVASVTNNAPATFPLGNTTVTWIVTDGAGLVATCTQIVTVTDAEAPTITCPVDVAVNADAGLCTASGVALGVPTTGDNCSVASVTNNAPISYPLGNTTVTWTVTDGAGLVTTCNQIVTVTDAEVPTIVCPPNVTVSADPGVCTAAAVALGLPTTSDNCSVASVTNDAPAVFPLGNTNVTWTVTDGAGLTATCVQIVTVNDTEPPTINCPPTVIVGSDAGLCSASGVALGVPTTTDNCSVASVTNNAPAIFPLGNTTVTWIVTDGAGLVATCTQTVTVNDTENPSITCPADVSVNADAGVCTASGVALGSPTTADNCSVASVTNNAPATFPLGNTTVTWTVTDGSGLVSTCNQIVTVTDNELPTITCPVNVNVVADLGLCTASGVALGVPTTADNCSVASVTNNAPVTYPLGVTVVTWTVTDGAGLIATCVQTVTVTDTQVPTITCPPTVTVNADAGLCTASGVVLGVPITSDNCSIASVSNNGPAIYPLGNTTVTWVVIDGAGLVTTCTQTVTVVDAENPTISCPPTVTVSADPGLCTASGVALGVPAPSDNCSVASVTNNAPATFPLGNTTVTWTVTDAAGLIGTCNQIVTVTDNENPTIVCPADITANSIPGLCGAVVVYTPPTGVDNCIGASTVLVGGLASGSLFPVGVTTVTYEVTDGSGNTSQCSFDVEVLDIEPPVINCPGNIVVNNDVGFCGAIVNFVVPIGTDNCPGPVTSLIAGLAPGSLFPVGTTVVTYEVVDASGNATQCSFNVTVNDTENPSIICPADITVNNDLGVCGAVVNFTAPVGIDNCPLPTTTLIAGLPPGSFFPVGATTVTYEVVDASGNATQCSIIITVNDTENPTLVCPADITVSNDIGFCAAIVNYLTPSGVDNCPGSVTSMTAGLASGSSFPVGTTTVTYEVVDAAGNTVSCSFDVIVTDDELPTIVCPADITVSNDVGVCGATVVYVAPTGVDNCPLPVTSLIAGLPSGSVFPVGVNVVTYEVVDAAGNPSQCSFNVTVTDDELPSITCPVDIVVSNDVGVCGAIVNFVAPVGSDNCPLSVTTLTAGLPSGSLFPIGTTTVTFDVTDASGNSVQCSFDVTVNDNEFPVIVCPGDINQNNDIGVCGAVVTYVAPVGTDNCPSSITIQIAGLPSGSLYPIGTTTNTFEVTDASGNVTTCSFDVIITDAEFPTIICPPDVVTNNDLGQCGAIVNYITPVGADNCPLPNTLMIAGQASGTLFPVGTTTVTYEVTDASGNITICSFDVTITDSELPAIICPADITVNNDAGICGALVNYVAPVGSDNCPGQTTVLIAGQASGTIFPVGVTTVTYEVTDAAGNISTCSFDVTVIDNEVPTIVCPPDQNVSFDSNCEFILQDYTGLATIGDNCGAVVVTQFPLLGTAITGIQTITLTATDGSGNFSTCTFDIIPVDNTIPTVTCPGNQNVFFDTNCEHILLDYTGMASAADNCGVASIVQSPAAGTVITITTTVSIIVTDLSGNVNTCTFNVIPEDNIDPVIACPTDQIVSLDGVCQYTMIDFTGLAVPTDNCGIVSYVQFPAPGFVITSPQLTTFTVMDAAGNSATCSFTVDPIDDTPPPITCPGDQNVSFDANCQFILPDYTLSTITSDNCGAPMLAQSPLPGSAITTTQTVTVTSTDASGNVSFCTFDVIPVDDSPPVITACPSDVTEFVTASCKFTIPDYTGGFSAFDNCGTVIINQIPAAGTDVGVNTIVTMEAVDGVGNSSTCSFNVFLSDTISPTITCPPSDLDVFFDVNCEYIIVDNSGLGSAFDNCAPPTITQNPPIGTSITANQVMTLIATDASGNTSECTFNIIPQDTIAPVIGCPVDQISYLNDTCYSVLEDYTALANTTANCEAVLVTQSPAPGTVFNSTQTVLLFGEDASGNVSFCSFNVTLADTIAPEILCPADTFSCDNVIVYPQPTATDNCNVASITRITGLPSGSTFPDGPTLMTFVALDDFGNSDTCTFTINVYVKPDAAAAVTNISCFGEVDGMIDLTISAGNPPFVYDWSTSEVTEDIAGLVEGTYQCIITDSQGCVDTIDADVIEPDSLWIVEEVTPISCYGEIDGSVFVTVNGGTFPYSYIWSPSGGGNQANGLAAGDYTLQVVDGAGCSVTEVYTIIEPDSISLTTDISQYSNGYQISVENGTDGFIDVTVNGGTAPFDYIWDTGQMDPFITDLASGYYTITVTDSMGCEYIEAYFLDQPLAVVPSNAFSPNGDGLNDYFVLLNIERYPENTLTVMNRWGDVVYQKAGYNNEWDGTPNKGIVMYGSTVPEGSYYYVLDLGKDQGKTTGFIVINR